jgi:hypothetical protein
MAKNTLTAEGFQVNRTLGIPVETREITPGAVYHAEAVDVDHSAAAEKMMQPSAAERAAAAKAETDVPFAAATALYEANLLLVADAPSMEGKFEAWLRACPMNEDGDELIDSICAATHRKVERKDRDLVKAMDAYRRARASDKETEIGRQQFGEAEDRVNELRDAIDRWEAMHKVACRVYEARACKQWQSRDRMAIDKVLATDAAAQWERQYANSKLMQAKKIFVTGGGEGEPHVDEYIAKVRAKVGDKLLVVVADSDSGFDGKVREACHKQGIEVFAVPFKDDKAKTRHFDRQRDIFNKMNLAGVAVMGGRGLQCEAVKLAKTGNIPLAVVIPPTAQARQ